MSEITHLYWTEVDVTKLRLIGLSATRGWGTFEVVETSEQFLAGEVKAMPMTDPGLYHRTIPPHRWPAPEPSGPGAHDDSGA